VALRHLEDEPDPLPGDVPEPVRELISRAMAKNPAERFASAADFADAALEASGPVTHGYATGTRLAVPAGTTTITRTVPPPAAVPLVAPPHRRSPRHQTAVLFTVLALLLVAAGVGVAIALSSLGDKDPGGTPAPVPPVTPTSSLDPSSAEPSLSARPIGTPRGTNKPNAGGGRPSATGTPSVPATPSTGTTSTTPSTAPTSKTSTTTPPASTTPTDQPTATDPTLDGGGGGADEDTD
jgi:serine/threonine-protein kinase